MKIKTRDMALVALFAALMAVGAYVKILLPNIPFTLQPLFCAFAGILLGAKLGALSQIVYVAMGLLGLPVFTKPAGPQYIFEPSFGYLIGFILGAFVIGWISERIGEINFKRALVSILAGVMVMYLVGVPYMYMIVNLYLGKVMTVKAAMMSGFLILIWKDVLLSFGIAVAACKILPILRRENLVGMSSTPKTGNLEF